MPKKMLQNILRIASSLTLAEAMESLGSLDEAYLTYIVYEDYPGHKPLQFVALGDDSFNLLKPCSRIGPFWFYCGPPCRRSWANGMASQFVADRILSAIVETGAGIVSAKLSDVLLSGAP
ncbi:MAG: hypothetical protein ACYSUB_01925 [Planctomycetota bacterium]|jgi:hypothetical protein